MDKAYLVAAIPLLILYLGYTSLFVGYRNFPFVKHLRKEKTQAVIQGATVALIIGLVLSIPFLIFYNKNYSIFFFISFYCAAAAFITIEWIPIISKKKNFSFLRKIIYYNKIIITYGLIFASSLFFALDLNNFNINLFDDTARLICYIFSLTFIALSIGKLLFASSELPFVYIYLTLDNEEITGYFLGYSDFGDIILSKDQYPETSTEIIIVSKDITKKIVYKNPIKSI